MSTNLENSAVATGLEKVSLHPGYQKGSTKECSNHRTVALTSDANQGYAQNPSSQASAVREPTTSGCTRWV